MLIFLTEAIMVMRTRTCKR